MNLSSCKQHHQVRSIQIRPYQILMVSVPVKATPSSMTVRTTNEMQELNCNSCDKQRLQLASVLTTL